jgi:hypothetical protein
MQACSVHGVRLPGCTPCRLAGCTSCLHSSAGYLVVRVVYCLHVCKACLVKLLVCLPLRGPSSAEWRELDGADFTLTLQPTPASPVPPFHTPIPPPNTLFPFSLLSLRLPTSYLIAQSPGVTCAVLQAAARLLDLTSCLAAGAGRGPHLPLHFAGSRPAADFDHLSGGGAR